MAQYTTEEKAREYFKIGEVITDKHPDNGLEYRRTVKSVELLSTAN